MISGAVIDARGPYQHYREKARTAMNVIILGITTGLGRVFSGTLSAHGLTPVGLVHKAEHEASLRAAGTAALLVPPGDRRAHAAATQALADAGAIVMATGTGVGPDSFGSASGMASPSAALMAAAEQAGVRRFLMVSALLPAETARAGLGPLLDQYLQEKKQAECALRERDLDWCVLRPGMLDDSPGTGRISVKMGADPSPAGRISRADLAETMCALLLAPVPIRSVLAVSAGTVPIQSALEEICETSE
ncbi:NAD(P)H-binding protein [Streptomyces avermitilis]